jgi:hypothetical protein
MPTYIKAAAGITMRGVTVETNDPLALVAEIRRLEAEATKGPWVDHKLRSLVRIFREARPGVFYCVADISAPEVLGEDLVKGKQDNAAFIVALRNNALLLCDIIERQQQALKQADEWFSHFGFNPWGVVMSDDLPDHEPVIWTIKAALEGAKDGDGELTWKARLKKPKTDW